MSQLTQSKTGNVSIPSNAIAATTEKILADADGDNKILIGVRRRVVVTLTVGSGGAINGIRFLFSRTEGGAMREKISAADIVAQYPGSTTTAASGVVDIFLDVYPGLAEMQIGVTAGVADTTVSAEVNLEHENYTKGI